MNINKYKNSPIELIQLYGLGCPSFEKTTVKKICHLNFQNKAFPKILHLFISPGLHF